MELFGSALLVVSLRQVLLRCRLAADLSLIQRAAIHFMHYPVNPFKLIEIGNMKFLLFLIPDVIPASYEDVVVRRANAAIAVQVREICRVNNAVAIDVVRGVGSPAPERPQPGVVRA